MEEAEAINVFPQYCPFPERRCASCMLEGKIQCDPRFILSQPEDNPLPAEGSTEVTTEAQTEEPTKVTSLMSTKVTDEAVSHPRAAQPKKRFSTKEKHAYFESHKAEIIADIVEHGLLTALEDWKMSKGAWANARVRWRDDLRKAGYRPYGHRMRPETVRAVSGKHPQTRTELFWFRQGWRACRRQFITRLKELLPEK